jgi:hypothetical protein
MKLQKGQSDCASKPSHHPEERKGKVNRRVRLTTVPQRGITWSRGVDWPISCLMGNLTNRLVVQATGQSVVSCRIGRQVGT